MRNESRSMNNDMADGATDGKYRKARPNTVVAPGMGDQTVKKNRASLHPYNNWGFANSEQSDKVNPGAN